MVAGIWYDCFMFRRSPRTCRSVRCCTMPWQLTGGRPIRRNTTVICIICIICILLWQIYAGNGGAAFNLGGWGELSPIISEPCFKGEQTVSNKSVSRWSKLLDKRSRLFFLHVEDGMGLILYCPSVIYYSTELFSTGHIGGMPYFLSTSRR